jgi:hypothetical protein
VRYEILRFHGVSTHRLPTTAVSFHVFLGVISGPESLHNRPHSYACISAKWDQKCPKFFSSVLCWLWRNLWAQREILLWSHVESPHTFPQQYIKFYLYTAALNLNFCERSLMQYFNPNRSNYIAHFNGSVQTINTTYFFSSIRVGGRGTSFGLITSVISSAHTRRVGSACVVCLTIGM